MSLKEKVREAGKREIDSEYVCPVLGPVLIRSLSEAEFQEGVLLWSVNQDWTRNRDRRKFENAKMIQMCVVDEDGNTEYSESIEDIAEIAGMRRKVFNPLYARVMAWNEADVASKN